MSAMKTPLSVCPVPSEQQPINEYQALQESWFYRWGSQTVRGYWTPIGVLWGMGWLIAGPIAAVSFPPAKFFMHFCLSTTAGAALLPILALVQLYLGWRYVRDRLLKETVPYEESGWYDGQLWTKPDEVLARDRLVVSYQIQPILQRLHWTFGSLAIALLMGVVLWNLV